MAVDLDDGHHYSLIAIAQFTAKKREFAIKNNRKNVCDFLIAIIALHPHSRGEVKLRSRDYRDDPIINLNFLDKNEDVDVIIEGNVSKYCAVYWRLLVDNARKILKSGFHTVLCLKYASGRHQVCIMHHVSRHTI